MQAVGEKQTPEQIIARVGRAPQRIDAKRITLNPDCGFAPGSAAKVDLDEVYLKRHRFARWVGKGLR